MKKLFLFATCFLGLVSCIPHEYPTIPGKRDFKVNLNYDYNFINWEFSYSDNGLQELGIGESTKDCLTNAKARYKIRAYPYLETKSSYYSRSYTRDFIFKQSLPDSYDCSFDLSLPTGKYTIMAWSDFGSTNTEHYYNTNNLGDITLLGKYSGNNQYRQAFRGIANIDLPSDIKERNIELDLDMQRPQARYELIASDLAKFIETELTRYRVNQKNFNTKAVSIDFSKYKAVFYYVGYVPNAYSMFTDKPIDSTTGVLFETPLKHISDNEMSIGFDYVFVNGTKSAVTVQVAIIDESGNQLALTEPIEIPLKRNHNTIIRGNFLTKQAAGGVRINPDYDGEYNIFIQ